MNNSLQNNDGKLKLNVKLLIEFESHSEISTNLIEQKILIDNTATIGPSTIGNHLGKRNNIKYSGILKTEAIQSYNYLKRKHSGDYSMETCRKKIKKDEMGCVYQIGQLASHFKRLNLHGY